MWQSVEYKKVARLGGRLSIKYMRGDVTMNDVKILGDSEILTKRGQILAIEARLSKSGTCSDSEYELFKMYQWQDNYYTSIIIGDYKNAFSPILGV